MSKRLFLVLCCLAAAASASAQPAGDGTAGSGAWRSLRVPGGVAPLLKAAGLDESLPRVRALREVVRVIHETAAGVDDQLDARRRNLVTYLESISAVESLRLGQDRAPLRLRQADDRNTRKRLDAIAEAIGCTLERASGTYRLTPDPGERQTRRRADLAGAGLDYEALIAAANAGQPLSISLPVDDVPQPIAPESWAAILRAPDKLSGTLATAILGDRATALLYYGLLGSDAATREFFQQDTALLKAIVGSGRAAVFAGHSQGIRVAAGRVTVPGGAAAEPLWQDLAGEPVSRPDRFILRLLDKDGGRLASLFDAAHELDGPHQAFVLGSWIADADARAGRFRSLYAAYARLLSTWDPVARPFVRTIYDGAQVLAMTDVDRDGNAAGPTSVRLWRRAFDGIDLPADPAGVLGDPESDGHADAAWLLEALTGVGHSFAERRSRAEAWLFGQRAFRGVPAASLPHVLVTLRGFSRFRALNWTLERMGVSDPAVYASAVRQADRLSRISSREREAVALALFQGSVAIVERSRAARTIDAAAAQALVRALCDVPTSESGEYLGGVGAWMTKTLLPALAEGLPPLPGDGEPSAEETILRAMAGRALSMADSPNLELWLEGLPYSVDVAASEYARMQAVREKQRGVPLEAGLALGRAADALGAPGVTLAQVPGLASDLDRAAQAVVKLGGPGMGWLDQGWYRNQIASAASDLGKIKKAGDLRKLERIAFPFLQTADRLQSQAALSLAYAALLRDPQSTTLLDRDPAPRHDWTLQAADDESRESPPWREPVPERTGGWHLSGSLLGADLALANDALRRVSIDRFPSPPAFSDSDEHAVAETVALIVPFDQSDADRDSLVTALARGRSMVDRVLRQPSLWPDAADAMQMRDFRRALLPWAAANEPAAVPMLLSLEELVLLGRLEGDAPAWPDAWGVSARAYDGRWGLRARVPLPFDLLGGRKGASLAAGLVPGLMLSVAEAMRERQVPAVLTRAVLECAARDAIDEMPLQYFDDWVTLIGHSRLVAGRIDEYLASLTGGGPLVPVPR